MASSRPPERRWRGLLGKVPGLKPAYRALRAAWWRLKDSAADRWWLFRGRAPFGLWSRQRVMAVWAEGAERRERIHGGEATLWLDSPQVLRDYVFPQFEGKHWYQYVADRCCPQPRERGLSLCCGDGEVERNLLRFGICQRCEGLDVSVHALQIARRKADQAGFADRLSYRVADIERAYLTPESYDVIVAWMALHHLRNLRHVLSEVRRALKPDGIFIMNEYVGPARFQVPDERVALVNSLLASLPEELRRKPGGAAIKESFARPRLSEIIRHDPSEAVSSHRILAELRRRLVIAEEIGYGGAILQWLLEGIVQNFREDDPVHRAHLERLYAAERHVLSGGRFATDFAFVIAKRPTRP
jgi:ubiquinone/menaquinone biosynthesis C-methylase UbiE